MSLTFKVTIPIESLETLQRMSPFYDTVYRVWERNDESEAVLKACKSIVTALKDIPYELTPKKTKGKDGPCPCGNDWCQVSGYEQEGSSHEDQDYDEVDDGSEVYDEIDAEECDHRSTSGSVFEKGIHDWESTQDVTNDDSARTIDRNTETDERVADTESPHDEREPTEFDGDETTESKDLARSDIQIDITVISNGDWSGNSYRMTLYYNDTWSELASKLKRSFTRFEDDDMSLSFYFGYSFYDEGCQAPLFKAGVDTDSVIYVQTGPRGQAPMPRQPLAWPGTYAYMPIARDNILGARQVPPVYDSHKQTVAYERSPTKKTGDW